MWEVARDSVLAHIAVEVDELSSRVNADEAYFGEINKRAERLCVSASLRLSLTWSKMDLPKTTDDTAWRSLRPNMEAHLARLEPENGKSGTASVLALICIVMLWKSYMVESRGMKFVAGVLMRKIEELLCRFEDIGEIRPMGDTLQSEVAQELENVLFILLGVHNTSNKYDDQGAKHPDMEKLISAVLSRECKFFPKAQSRAASLSQKDVYRYRGTMWDDPVIARRFPSACLAVFLRKDGDLFTALEGGLFTLTPEQRSEREEWKNIQAKESDRVMKKYAFDKDGWYYRTLGWRSAVVYLGTLGALTLSLIVTVLDLGEEGKNVFKRMNFFATLAISLDLIILGILKIVDRNDKAVTDGIFFKKRVFDIAKEFSPSDYSAWRKAMAYDASKMADMVSPTNMCYSSAGVRGSIISPKKMTKQEVKEMFAVLEHGYHEGMKNLVNKSTGQQFSIVQATETSSHISPAPSYGIAFTGIVREVRDEDNISELGSSS